MIVAASPTLLRQTSTGATLVDVLEQWASLQPSSLAYCFLQDGEDDEEMLTYAELQTRAKRIAVFLQSSVQRGERILLIYEAGLDFIAAFLGCLYAGVIAVPVNLPSKRQRYHWIQTILGDSESRFILTTELIRSQILEDGAAPLAKDVSILTEGDGLGCNSCDWIEPCVSSDSIAFLQYTSGSTRMPKGVMVTHANILANEGVIEAAFRHDSSTLGLGWLPHYHDMGLIGNILQTLYIGRPCILMSPFHFVQKPYRWLRAISKYKATSSGGPNFAYQMCVERITEQQKQSLDLSSWDVAFTGAEIIRADTLKSFAEAFSPVGFNPQAFYPCYGLAEATLFVTGRRNRRPMAIRRLDASELSSGRVVEASREVQSAVTAVGCGESWPGHQVIIVDPETSRPCASEQVGEIWVHGPSVARGYWRRPEEHKLSFAATLLPAGEGPFLRTGDLGFIADDELYITGRLKDLIIIRGQNYYPHEIEASVQASVEGLTSHAGAAFAIEHDDQERLVIVQELARSHLRAASHDHMISRIRSTVLRCHGLNVHAIVLAKPATVPRTSSGKIKRTLCRQMYIENQFDGLCHWLDRTR